MSRDVLNMKESVILMYNCVDVPGKLRIEKRTLQTHFTLEITSLGNVKHLATSLG